MICAVLKCAYHLYFSVVQISSTGSNIAGSAYTLTCTVSVVTGTPNITWFNPIGDEVDNSLLTLSDDGSELILQFQSLNYSDIGMYNCSANLSIPALDFLGMGSHSVTVDIQSMHVNIILDF